LDEQRAGTVDRCFDLCPGRRVFFSFLFLRRHTVLEGKYRRANFWTSSVLVRWTAVLTCAQEVRQPSQCPDLCPLFRFFLRRHSVLEGKYRRVNFLDEQRAGTVDRCFDLCPRKLVNQANQANVPDLCPGNSSPSQSPDLCPGTSSIQTYGIFTATPKSCTPPS